LSFRFSTPLTYSPDPGELFSRIRHLAGALFLDSCACFGQKGRYDLIAALPAYTLSAYGDRVDIRQPDHFTKETPASKSASNCPVFTHSDSTQISNSQLGRTQPGRTQSDRSQLGSLRSSTSQKPPLQTLYGNPVTILKDFLHSVPSIQSLCSNSEAGTLSQLPFCGGAIGWWGYDIGRQIEPLPSHTLDDQPDIEDMWCGLYDTFILVDHHLQRTTLYALPLFDDSDTRTSRFLETVTALHDGEPLSSAPKFTVHSTPEWSMNPHTYQHAFEKIQNYLHQGDCYQVNLAMRRQYPVSGDPWLFYQHLRKQNPAPYSAFIQTENTTLISCSPESFIDVFTHRAVTRPIKGTTHRSNCPAEDEQLKKQLATCPKNRAENLMIVDLMRNDLGKRAIAGSVKVNRLFDVESYAGIHHLVSEIECLLAPSNHPLDLLHACFPGGSITGTPKIRAIQIIEELEQYRRKVYCGSIGYCSLNGHLSSSIAIRTATIHQGKLTWWAGGGIVADSRCEDEYQEIQQKSAIFERALRSFLNINP
jgi:para-aminobenzoate synthetase component 1